MNPEKIKKKIGNKFRLVMRSDYNIVDTNLKHLLTFLNKNLITSSILEELRSRDIYKKGWKPKTRGMGVDLELPENELDYVSISLSLLERGSKEPRFLVNLGCRISRESKLDRGIRYFNEVFTKRLYEYIIESIDDSNFILYLLKRFKARCEWFHKKDLYELYELDPKHGEKLLTKELREFLFDQGIDYPFSEPETPSGKPDLVHGINGDNPLTLEIKLFKPDKGYDRAYIRKGFRQAFDYAEDYDQPFGYLLIFNLSDYNIKFTLKNSSKPIKVQLGDRVIFIVIINLFDDGKSSSQKRKIKPYEITEEYLKSEE